MCLHHGWRASQSVECIIEGTEQATTEAVHGIPLVAQAWTQQMSAANCPFRLLRLAQVMMLAMW